MYNVYEYELIKSKTTENGTKQIEHTGIELIRADCTKIILLGLLGSNHLYDTLSTSFIFEAIASFH